MQPLHWKGKLLCIMLIFLSNVYFNLLKRMGVRNLLWFLCNENRNCRCLFSVVREATYFCKELELTSGLHGHSLFDETQTRICAFIMYGSERDKGSNPKELHPQLACRNGQWRTASNTLLQSTMGKWSIHSPNHSPGHLLIFNITWSVLSPIQLHWPLTLSTETALHVDCSGTDSCEKFLIIRAFWQQNGPNQDYHFLFTVDTIWHTCYFNHTHFSLCQLQSFLKSCHVLINSFKAFLQNVFL